jgi:hypothetical protein
MRLLAGLLLVVAAAPSPQVRYFHYQRAVENPSRVSGQVCLVLDATMFQHTAPQLADLRLFQGGTETPYVVQMVAPAVVSPQQIALLNAGRRGGLTVFDAAMPEGRYGDLDLAVSAHDFIATVTVSGSQAQDATATRIGSYTIFDLRAQRLGRSTILHLPESDFRFLHFSIAGAIAPENVAGLSVARLPASQPKYVTVAESTQVARSGHQSTIEFTEPGHTPVDRIVFVPGTEPAAFSRDVQVKVSPITGPPANDAAEPAHPVTSAGSLLRLHRVQDGHRIDEERLSVDAPWSNFDTPTKWSITIENGDDTPIQISSVRLEMLERNLCFEAVAGADYTLYYGDAALVPPQYDYATLFARQASAAQVATGPERPNPAYGPRPDDRPFTEKHPALLWIALALVVAVLGLVALRSAKLTAQTPS